MSSVGYGSSQASRRLHPISIFAQITSRNASGCLRITSGSLVWSIYLEQGKLAFASNSINPFERLDRYLNQLGQRTPALVSAVCAQARLLFEPEYESQALVTTDWLAIQWLVDQQYLSSGQATQLVEELAKEVIESLLKVTEGSYGLIEKEVIDSFPGICQLDLRPIVEYCQTQLRQQAQSKPSALLPQEPKELEPHEDPVATKSAQASTGEPLISIPQPQKGHYTIACIDDSPTVLQAINSFLDDGSFSIVMISDPLKALIQIVRCKPDLILLDVGMPNLDGYELCSMLRRHSSFKNTPIVMVTGHTGFIDRAKAKLVGASGYLTKPFTRSELMKMVFKYLT
ncbi:MAG: response regulator [Leptolyngbyaceae cyanobacterium RU_5_1]|nr:response regulator [Leptolyngbyaceae cyanobacterium RU_5_1]